jgi:hypothetical protein
METPSFRSAKIEIDSQESLRNVEVTSVTSLIINGEFDPGSGRTLAACLKHASRTVTPGACSRLISGERVSNT